MTTQSPDASRTYHASQAVQLSDLVNLKFSPHRFGTEHPRYVHVREPDGPSTDKGRKARQAILLRAQDEDESNAIVCGFIDGVNKKAELKSYPVVKAAFESRFSKDIDISRGEYNRLVDLLREFLDTQAMETRIVSDVRRPSVTPRGDRAPIAAPSPQAVPMLAIGLAFGFGFLTCYLLMHFSVLG